MRTINELLIILRDNAKVKKSWFGLRLRINAGLCCEIFKITRSHSISDCEWVILTEYINRYAPPSNSDGFKWPPYKWKPRLKWLNEQIELTKEV